MDLRFTSCGYKLNWRMIGSSRDRLRICCCMLASRWLMSVVSNGFYDLVGDRRLFDQDQSLRLVSFGKKPRYAISERRPDERQHDESKPNAGEASPCNLQLSIHAESFHPLSPDSGEVAIS